MDGISALDDAVDALADRLRRLPESTLRAGAGAAGLRCARELARRAQLLERPGREPAVMPDAGMFAVGDQVAVAGHDLADALRAMPGADAELREALALVRSVR
ncbi:hypothetical protein [Streptomyces sodiiphilus]